MDMSGVLGVVTTSPQRIPVKGSEKKKKKRHRMVLILILAVILLWMLYDG